MNFIKSFLILGALTLSLAFQAFGHEKKWPEKRLRQVWPSAQIFISKQISLTSSQISQLGTEGVKIGSEDRSPTFYFAQEKDPATEKPKTLGIILFIDEYGANGTMEISVAMGADGKTKKIDIWDHSENPLVAKDDFLNQFVGKTAKDTWAQNVDYKPIAGAAQASEAVAKATRKALKITNIVFEKK